MSLAIVSSIPIAYSLICRLKFIYSISIQSSLDIFQIVILIIDLIIINIKKSLFNFIMSGIEQANKQQPKPVNIAALDKRVWAVYTDLQKAVDNMDRRVEMVMQKHQSQFLYAYRTHIHKIKRELQDIKSKSEEQERLFSSNDRIRYLEKEVAIFREEAIELYQKIQKKSLEIQVYKTRVSQAEAISRKLQSENRQLSIQIKRLSSYEADYNRNMAQMQKKVAQSNKKIQKLQKKLSLQKSRRDYMESTRERASSLAKSGEKSPREFQTYRNEMQQWFLECIKSVKKEIHQRKNSFETLDLNRISSISQFRLVDKLRLFQLVLENEKLLNWLYHRIFPDRFDKMSQYLSHNASVAATDTDIKTNIMPSQRYFQGEQNFQLPKVSSRKMGSNNLGNQFVMKNGKINILIT